MSYPACTASCQFSPRFGPRWTLVSPGPGWTQKNLILIVVVAATSCAFSLQIPECLSCGVLAGRIGKSESGPPIEEGHAQSRVARRQWVLRSESGCQRPTANIAWKNERGGLRSESEPEANTVFANNIGLPTSWQAASLTVCAANGQLGCVATCRQWPAAHPCHPYPWPVWCRQWPRQWRAAAPPCRPYFPG